MRKHYCIAWILASTITLTVNSLAQNPTLTGSKGALLRVAFVVSERFNLMDFTGPLEVFKTAVLPVSGKKWEEGKPLFEVYTVSDSTARVNSGEDGSVAITPSFTFANAPAPDIVVIGAQQGDSDAMHDWLRKQNAAGAILMSVCVGAGNLQGTGLLDGKTATTHHDYLDRFREGAPKTNWVGSRRFVKSTETIYTAGGLTSGIDLALHLVAKRFGESIAQGTADYIEYQGTRWKEKD